MFGYCNQSVFTKPTKTLNKGFTYNAFHKFDILLCYYITLKNIQTLITPQKVIADPKQILSDPANSGVWCDYESFDKAK